MTSHWLRDRATIRLREANCLIRSIPKPVADKPGSWREIRDRVPQQCMYAGEDRTKFVALGKHPRALQGSAGKVDSRRSIEIDKDRTDDDLPVFAQVDRWPIEPALNHAESVTIDNPRRESLDPQPETPRSRGRLTDAVLTTAARMENSMARSLAEIQAEITKLTKEADKIRSVEVIESASKC